MSIISFVLKPLAYLGVPAFFLHHLSNTSPLARYYIRLSLYVSTISLCSVWGVIVSIALAAVGQRFNVNWVIARSFYALAGRVLDIRFVVQGEEHLNTRPAVLVGNHQSMVDILYLGRIFPMRASIMAKKELQWMPFLGQFLTASGAVFVDRGNNAKAVRSLAAAGETMRSRGTSLWLFPEGTRSMRPYHDLLPFKRGAFHLAVQAGVPVIPVVCENYWRLYHKNVFESGILTIRVLPPISTEGLTAADVQSLAERVRTQMIVALREISDPNAPSPPSLHTSVEKTPAPVAPAAEREPVVATAPDPAPAPDNKGGIATPATPASEAMSLSEESAYRGSETEEDEGMVLVGRPER
ncbi:hypothetical protein K488DRAFT_67345 [Vararia minispora EC-137]|uniref:Uncharacterized protein n=1 Tax=Vararia minispora EC-137 TaxID=1314806 RepID=A0ACB8QZC6_9AGAM|nr:hypothetical protein K488DRAFT_67345 [Vararia minispora EC-137]